MRTFRYRAVGDLISVSNDITTAQQVLALASPVPANAWADFPMDEIRPPEGVPQDWK